MGYCYRVICNSYDGNTNTIGYGYHITIRAAMFIGVSPSEPPFCKNTMQILPACLSMLHTANPPSTNSCGLTPSNYSWRPGVSQPSRSEWVNRTSPPRACTTTSRHSKYTKTKSKRLANTHAQNNFKILY